VTFGSDARRRWLIIQLMHVGGISRRDNTSRHGRPVAPSAVTPNSLRKGL
jgi:hypothetical protein